MEPPHNRHIRIFARVREENHARGVRHRVRDFVFFGFRSCATQAERPDRLDRGLFVQPDAQDRGGTMELGLSGRIPLENSRGRHAALPAHGGSRMAASAVQRFKMNLDFPISAIAPVVIAEQIGMTNNAL